MNWKLTWLPLYPVLPLEPAMPGGPCCPCGPNSPFTPVAPGDPCGGEVGCVSCTRFRREISHRLDTTCVLLLSDIYNGA